MKIFHHLKQGTSFGNLESGSCQEWHCTEIIQQQFLVDFLIIVTKFFKPQFRKDKDSRFPVSSLRPEKALGNSFM